MTDEPAPADEPAAAPPRTRREFLAAFADLTPFDLVLAARAADTPEELDQVAHLSLALFDHVGCLAPVSRPDGVLVDSLHQQIIRGRTRVNGWPADVAARAELFDRISAEATEIRKARARAARQEQDQLYQSTRAPRVHHEGAPQ